MAGEIASHLAARARRALGLDDLRSQLDRLGDRVGGIEGAIGGLQAAAGSGRYPLGPLYLGDHTALVGTRWGGKLVVDTTDQLLAPWLLLDGLWESHITGWLEQHVQPGFVVVDIGANIGYFTVLAGRLVGSGGRVVAVEAHPHLADILRSNVIINGLHGWTTVWERAAWSGHEELTFHQRAHHMANSSIASAGEGALRSLGDTEVAVQVQGVALDEVLEDLPRLDVLKLDVEGAEVRALAGLASTLARHQGIRLLVEWSPQQLEELGEDPRRLLDVLVDHGFALRLFELGLASVEPDQVLETPYGNLLAERPQHSAHR